MRSSFQTYNQPSLNDTTPPNPQPNKHTTPTNQPTKQETLQELADFNRRYEERFGYIFLVCATGKTAEEMLALLKARMGNEPAGEVCFGVRVFVGAEGAGACDVDCVIRVPTMLNTQ
jgi:hypothetical protein